MTLSKTNFPESADTAEYDVFPMSVTVIDWPASFFGDILALPRYTRPMMSPCCTTPVEVVQELKIKITAIGKKRVAKSFIVPPVKLMIGMDGLV